MYCDVPLSRLFMAIVVDQLDHTHDNEDTKNLPTTITTWTITTLTRRYVIYDLPCHVVLNRKLAWHRYWFTESPIQFRCNWPIQLRCCWPINYRLVDQCNLHVVDQYKFHVHLIISTISPRHCDAVKLVWMAGASLRWGVAGLWLRSTGQCRVVVVMAGLTYIQWSNTGEVPAGLWDEWPGQTWVDVSGQWLSGWSSSCVHCSGSSVTWLQVAAILFLSPFSDRRYWWATHGAFRFSFSRLVT